MTNKTYPIISLNTNEKFEYPDECMFTDWGSIQENGEWKCVLDGKDSLSTLMKKGKLCWENGKPIKIPNKFLPV